MRILAHDPESISTNRAATRSRTDGGPRVDLLKAGHVAERFRTENSARDITELRRAFGVISEALLVEIERVDRGLANRQSGPLRQLASRSSVLGFDG
jgi:hypothetical protein